MGKLEKPRVYTFRLFWMRSAKDAVNGGNSTDSGRDGEGQGQFGSGPRSSSWSMAELCLGGCPLDRARRRDRLVYRRFGRGAATTLAPRPGSGPQKPARGLAGQVAGGIRRGWRGWRARARGGKPTDAETPRPMFWPGRLVNRQRGRYFWTFASRVASCSGVKTLANAARVFSALAMAFSGPSAAAFILLVTLDRARKSCA